MYAAPHAMPAKPISVMGVSITRRSPYLANSPFVTLYAPCGTRGRGEEKFERERG